MLLPGESDEAHVYEEYTPSPPRKGVAMYETSVSRDGEGSPADESTVQIQ